MIKRDDLIKFINETIGEELIQKALTKDEVANGVQFLGKDKINQVAIGVSLNEEFLKAAAAWGAEMVICHHGFDTRTWKSRFPIFAQKRLKVMIENKLTVMGWHYALDSHPKIGNNALIIKLLGATIKEPLFDEWGYTAEFSQAQDVEELKTRCKKLFNHEVLAILAGPKKVKTIGVVSGAGKPAMAELAEMEAKGVQLYISGETSEWIVHQMKESGINYFCGGHYATEVFGVQELGKKIKEKYQDKLIVEFIDIPNEI